MSRSRKDGRRGGNHNEARRTGKEYWGRRGGRNFSMATWGTQKRELHRAERRQHAAECVVEQ